MSSHQISRRIFPGPTPIAIDGPSGLRETHQLDISSCDKRLVTINILPDEILLLIFYRVIYLGDGYYHWHRLDPSWYRLVHVCQRWRSVIFGSPNFLQLKLVCHPSTRMELTGIWPPFPIIITDTSNMFTSDDHDFDAAFVYHDRICEISLFSLTSLNVERLASAMQVQFPALMDLRLQFYQHFDDFGPTPALPDGFLSGSVPRLQSLELDSIAFPALPKLLLSVTHLVSLTLLNIPDFGYFSPETMVANLSRLSNLQSLIIGFASRLYLPDRRPPPTTRTTLSALTCLELQGDNEFVEDVVARIDVPLLDSISITFFDELRFDIPQLALVAQFMRRMTGFKLNEIHVDFYDDLDLIHWGVQVGSLPPTRTFDDKSKLRIICSDPDGLLSSLAHVCTSFFPSIYMVEHLHFHGLPQEWDYDAEDLPWLEIFHPFTTVKSLYISRIFTRCITLSLRDLVGERVEEVLPALESLYFEDLDPWFVEKTIVKFVVARQLSGHPVTVSNWEREAL